MGCQHDRVRYRASSTRVSGVLVCHLEASCERCGAPFVFRGVASGLDVDGPRCNATGRELRLPLELAPTGAEQCPRCKVRLFGATVGEAPPLDRLVAVARIECGPVHVVHFADGVALRVGCGRVSLA